MSDGFMIWFLRGETTGRIVDHLGATGASLAYPIGEGRVSVLDLEGTQEIISSEAFTSLLEDNEAPTLTFQAWYSTAEDMVVTIRRNLTGGPSNTKFYAVTFYLDGLDTEQIDSAMSGTARIESRSPDEVVGIVIDKTGRTEDFDWDAFVCNPDTTPPVPDRLVLRREVIERNAVDPDAWAVGEPTTDLATLIDH